MSSLMCVRVFVSFTFTDLAKHPYTFLHSPTAVILNNSKRTAEPLITCTQPCGPFHGDHYITSLLLFAEHHFFFFKLPPHPVGLSTTSTIIKLFVRVLVGGKLCDSL